MSASPKSVCIPCRKVFKGSGHSVISESDMGPRGPWPLRWMGTGAGMHSPPDRCPNCRSETTSVDSSWRPPRRTNDRAWKQVAAGVLNTERRPVLSGWGMRGHRSGRDSAPKGTRHQRKVTRSERKW